MFDQPAWKTYFKIAISQFRFGKPFLRKECKANICNSFFYK